MKSRVDFGALAGSPGDSRDGPFGRGLALGVTWFPVFVRRLNIAGNGDSDGNGRHWPPNPWVAPGPAMASGSIYENRKQSMLATPSPPAKTR